MSDLVNIKDERFWQILFDEACVEGQQAERIEKELKKITVEPVRGEWQPYTLSKLFTHTCTACHCDVREKTPFCPWCGADMRKQGD